MPNSARGFRTSAHTTAGVLGGFRLTRASPILACLLAMAWAGAALAEEPAWKPARLWVACSETDVWVVGASEPRDKALAVLRLWQASGDDVELKPAPSRDWNINGNPVLVAADADALRILYSNNATWAYFGGRREAVPGSNWRDHSDAPPLAWGADPATRILWALAERRSEPAGDGEASTQPAETRPDDSSAVVASPDASDRMVLIELRKGRWHRHDVPVAVEAADAYWLVGHEETAGLFWRSRDGVVRLATFAGDGWSSAEVVARDVDIAEGLVTAWAGTGHDGPVFIVGRPVAEDRVQLHVYQLGEGGWATSDPVLEGNEYLALDPTRCGVGVRGDRLGVARPGAGGGVEFGWGRLDGSGPVRFSTLSTRTPSVPSKPDWMDTVMLGLLLGVLTVVIFSRREQINRPATVPRGFVIAPVWKRAAATLFDIMPAFFVMSACMKVFEGMLELPNDVNLMFERLDDPELMVKLVPFGVVFLMTYGIWCLAWELACGSTMGKRVFSCRVLSADGTVPSPRQIVVRNVIRVIMFAFGLQGLMVTFMMMVLLTRNRQRLGDLLGNTVVVEPGDAPQSAQG